MPPSLRLAAFAVAVSALMPIAANAMHDFVAASSSAPTAIKLCGEADGDKIKTAACKAAGYDRLVARIDKAFNTALAKAPANMKPLLKRDQNWFNEMLPTRAAMSTACSANASRCSKALTRSAMASPASGSPTTPSSRSRWRRTAA